MDILSAPFCSSLLKETHIFEGFYCCFKPRLFNYRRNAPFKIQTKLLNLKFAFHCLRMQHIKFLKFHITYNKYYRSFSIQKKSLYVCFCNQTFKIFSYWPWTKAHNFEKLPCNIQRMHWHQHRNTFETIFVYGSAASFRNSTELTVFFFLLKK